MTNKENTQLTIIGSGPAGYTAAIYAARAGLVPILYEGQQPGGQLITTTDVENYPGYPSGVLGPQMMEDFKKQALRFGTEVRSCFIEKVDFDSYPYKLYDRSGCEISSEAVIICTGASAKWLNIPSEERLSGKGVSACAVCDGFFYRNQTVAVVGGGDSAAEEALFLAKLCKKVYMLVRKDTLRASKIMQNRLIAKDNIEIMWNTETDEILGKEEVEGVRTKNNKTGEQITIEIQGFFVAIGHKPNSSVFSKYITTDDVGYIITEKDSSKTNMKGIFAAGDVQDSTYRQAITAAGSGCMAAMDAEKFLSEKEHM